MALVAALATALVAVGAAFALDGFNVRDVTISPVVYAVALVPALVSVGLGRRPPVAPKVHVPRPLIIGLFVVGVLVATEVFPAWAAGAVTTSAGLAAVAASFWWPFPSFLRLSLALTVVSLLRPGARPAEHVIALVITGAGAAVALVTCNRLGTSGTRVLGGIDPRPKPRRVAFEAGLVALALLMGAVLAMALPKSMSPPAGGATSAGDAPAEPRSSPLDYDDELRPGDAGSPHQGSDPDTVLLEVDTERPGVLRAITFDQWDGKTWRHDAESITKTTRPGLVPLFLTQLEVQFPGRIIEQRIRVKATYAGVAVATPIVYTYDLPVGAEVARDGTVRLEPALGRGAEYTAQTARVEVTAEMLTSAPAGLGAQQRDGPGVDQGLTEASTLSERARAVASRVTADSRSDYDKVTALSAHLAATVTIDEEAPALSPEADPIDSVLFGDRTASPGRLASTLAVLTRSVGIPSRLAQGFLPGERPLFGGDFVVRARDAHVWVEVPFIGAGWQRFDPSGRIAAAERQDSLWARLVRALQRYWPLILVVVAGVVALVARRIILRRRRLAAMPWVSRYFERLVKLGEKRGRARTPSETPAEYTAALAEGVLADKRLVEVGSVVTAAAWSGREPPDGTRRWAQQVLDEAAEATRPRRFRRRVKLDA